MQRLSRWAEFKLYWRDNLPDGDMEIESLMTQLGIAQSNIWVEKHGHHGLDKNEAHRRIREVLQYRWNGKLSIIGAALSVLGALVSWAALFV